MVESVESNSREPIGIGHAPSSDEWEKRNKGQTMKIRKEERK